MGRKTNQKMDGKTKQKLGKSMKNSSGNKKKKLKVPTLNPMFFLPGFPHIAEQIFACMEEKSLKNSRKVSKSWLNYIDNQNFLLKKIKFNNNGNCIFS